MKNTFGNAISMTIFGESHGPAIGAVLDGLAAGLPVNEAAIAAAISSSCSCSSVRALFCKLSSFFTGSCSCRVSLFFAAAVSLG